MSNEVGGGGDEVRKEVALDRLNLKPSNALRQDLADMPEEEPTQTMQVRPPGEEVTDFVVTLEKVRRLCFGVLCSDKRRRRLKEKCRQCDVDFRVPKGDAVGRWNTLYDMLSRFSSLRTPLHLLCFDDPCLMVSWPSPHEWEMITRCCDILQQYKAASLVMESESDVSTESTR
jgi:hypothetical protein